jgi:hypothetical protein
MKLKTTLATAAICTTALGGAFGAAPAAAKHDKPPKVKKCHERGSHGFSCDTTSGDTVSGECPGGYKVMSATEAGPEYDANQNGVVCFKQDFVTVDDTPTA